MVPNLPTAIPAASFASLTESPKLNFLTIPDAIYDTTVSPAPETSKTSLARDGRCNILVFLFTTEIPSELLVVITVSKPYCLIIFFDNISTE